MSWGAVLVIGDGFLDCLHAPGHEQVDARVAEFAARTAWVNIDTMSGTQAVFGGQPISAIMSGGRRERWGCSGQARVGADFVFQVATKLEGLRIVGGR